jgi:hypothetical protein
MTPFAKATLVLVTTFGLGAAVGYLGHAVQVQARERRPPQPDERREGFVQRMEALIAPRDAAQWSAIRPFVEATDAANRSAVDEARRTLRVNVDTLRARIDTLLDAGQRARLAEFAARPGPGGPPGLGGPPGPRGRPR